MANLEVLALDPTTPQIEAPQTGNGYSMPRLVNIAPEALTGTATTPSLAIAQAWSTTGAATALQVNVTSDTGPSVGSKLLDLQVGGAGKFTVDKTGLVTNITGFVVPGSNGASAYRAGFVTTGGANWYAGYSNNNAAAILGYQGVILANSSFLAWTSAAADTGADLYFYRDAANTLAQRNGVNAQAFRVYNTYTSSSIYEGAEISWSSNSCSFQGIKAGTGVSRALLVQGWSQVNVTPSGSFYFGGGSGPQWQCTSTALQGYTDNNFDIGATGGKPRTVYAGTSVTAPILITDTAYTVATLPVAGTAGRRAYVTNALAPAFLSAVVAGGSVVCPVFDNGTAWVCG